MKKAFASLFGLLLAFPAFSQEFEVPANYSFESAADYTAHNAEILEAIDWMLHTPAGTEPEKRKEVNRFFMQWITGTPDVTVEIDQTIVPFIEESPELLMIFMAGWAKHSLNSGKKKDTYGGSLAGLEAVLAFYQNNKPATGKVKSVEKLLKLQSKDKLPDYVRENNEK